MGPTVRFEGISKAYGSIRALRDISFECRGGEVHAVVGENGAGKSTLMGILGGFVRADRGTIALDGQPIAFETRRTEAGIAMVHQHFMLVPEFTVEENLALAALPGAGFAIRKEALAARALELGRSLGWEFDAREKTRTLSVGRQQRLEILKALATGAQVLILDEPTAVLGAEEVEELFRVLRSLRDEGRTVLLVAHRLSEVLGIADRITVLRHGNFVASAPRAEVDAEQLTLWMLGERLGTVSKPKESKGRVVLSARGLEVRGDRREVRVDGVSFEVAEGEVLGIGGVDGNGQVELAEALAGVRAFEGDLDRVGTTVGYIPPDRHRDGLALDMTIEENLLIDGHRHPDLRRGPFLLSAKIRDWAEGIRRKFQIAAPHVGIPVRNLSGGNQQKVVVGRSLDSNPKVLVAVNPTRGLDVRAAAFVRQQVREAAERGTAVVLFSTDWDELEEVSTRRLAMSGGRLAEPEGKAYLGEAH